MSQWKSFPLSEVASIDRSGVLPEDIAKGTSYLGLEHIARGGEIIGAQPVDKGELASAKFKFTKRHLLYGKLRPYLAKIACPDFSGICSTDILPVLPGPNLDRSFLCHFLRQPKMVDYANSRTAGANLPRLSPSALAEFQIPLPPLNDQRRIAAILDKADAIRRKRQESIRLTEELRHSIFFEIFGDPVTNKKGFPIKQMGNVCEVRDGTHDSPKYVSEGGYPLVTSKNLTGGTLDLTDVNFVSEADYIQINRRSKVDQGDIIMPMIGTIGSPVLIDHEPHYAIKNVALIKFRQDSPDAVFVRHLLSCHYFDYIVGRKSRGGTQQFISLGDLRSFPILIPPPKLQREFANQTFALEKIKAKQQSALLALVTLFNSSTQKAFRGEL